MTSDHQKYLDRLKKESKERFDRDHPPEPESDPLETDLSKLADLISPDRTEEQKEIDRGDLWLLQTIAGVAEKHLPERIVTCPEGVVVYRPVSIFSQMDIRKIDEKIREIFKAHPTADFTPYENSLGVKIVDVQYKGRSRPKGGGIFIGE